VSLDPTCNGVLGGGRDNFPPPVNFGLSEKIVGIFWSKNLGLKTSLGGNLGADSEIEILSTSSEFCSVFWKMAIFFCPVHFYFNPRRCCSQWQTV